MKTLCVVPLLVVLAGCGNYRCGIDDAMPASVPVVAPLVNLFPLQTLGENRTRWTFKNSRSADLTWFDFEPYKSFGYSKTPGTMMHITKSAVSTYWNPGLDAEVWQAESDDGTAIWSPGVSQRREEKFVTYSMRSMDTREPYYYLPDEYTEPFAFESRYRAIGTDQKTSEPITNPSDSYSWPWRIGVYTEYVSTPLYTGLAVVSHQCEGDGDLFQPGADYEEKWKFAPGIGLVEIEALREHNEAMEPALIIQRVE